ncbi:hypothetical protein XI08_25580 [Bradyrhizobium sp. CCBAU 11361]|nr:hypothetical protein [Bradyrhizobium sp. CCBAU 11361]
MAYAGLFRPPDYAPERDHPPVTCGGYARETVKALLVANNALETEIEQLRGSVSGGYSRRRFEAQPDCKE